MQLGTRRITLEVEDHGPTGGEVVVLIMGLGMQLVAWPTDFVAMLVARGLRVIRFDNRDIGLSQHFDALGVPNVAVESIKYAMGWPVRSPYSLADMADDTAAMLDAMGIESAHMCGASMGGMIAQHVAARHPARVKSMTLIMTSSGARHLPGPSLKVRAALVSRPKHPRDVDSVIDHFVNLYRLIGSTTYASGADELRERIGLSVRRSIHPQGAARQIVAIAADGDRSGLLAQLRVPTQIIHGLADPLVPAAAARDLAAKLKYSECDLIEGMGHDLPQALWPRFVAGICDAVGRAAA